MRKNFCAAWAVTICLAILILVPRTVVAKPGLLDIAEWPVTSSIHGGVLLLSDAPEYVGSEGIMYEDRAKGDIRIFFHHVNDLPDPVQVGVVLESIDGAPLSVTVRRVGISSPDPDYLRAGKQVQFDYFKDQLPYTVEVPAGKPLWLLPNREQPLVRKGQLVTGMLDLTADRELRVRLVMKSAHRNLAKFVKNAKTLPPGEPQLRGKFVGSDRLFLPDKVYDPQRDGKIAVTLADGIKDKFMQGWDATRNIQTENYGNYGIVYQLMIPTTGTGKFRCRIYPRGGVFAGWVLVRYNQQNSLIAVPAASVSFGDQGGDANQLLGEFEAGSVLWLRFSPPGSSNLPVRVVLEPVQ